MRILNNLYKILFHLGTLSGCHQLPERSFFIKGKQTPVCARCCGVFIGHIIFCVSICFFRISSLIGFIMCLPLIIDWIVQEYLKKESNNIRRLLTGILCGYGLENICVNALFSFLSLFISI